MSELTKHFEHEEVENRLYQHWMDKGYFRSVPDKREAYSIVIPPPNVTGVLHMGHMLNNTIQDILARKARLDGYNVCWVPGTDHASIATEAKVVQQLRAQGIKKSDLGREEFLKHAWAWTDKFGGIILEQLKKLGASCDWDRTAFTLDEVRSKQVIKAFVDLYNSGKLYRGLRMVNWDPEAKTVLSNEEVLYSDEHGKLYHVRYQVEGTEEFITIATTRPETILGDTALAVHPEDERYQHLKGKRAIVPLVNRSVPIIFDEYVERDFGTGALKVTPAHDINDYDLGLKHDLEIVDVLNDDGTMSAAAQFFIGEDRFAVRKQIVPKLEEIGALVKVEDYTNKVGRSERTNAIIEPKLSLQWYVDMQQIVTPALNAVMQDVVEFFPKNMKNTYNHWMSNIRDWAISRQLWWGHRIPAYYYEDEIFVGENAEIALKLAQEKYPDRGLTLADLRQDEDVLDTWFSSWLWPFSVFDGMEEGGEIEYYYPTSVLVTGWDIIFLWVARMVMAGYEWKQEKPFQHVYFTGMVRDKQRRKMSKSLGNSPDALQLIADFGADGVRFGMLSSSPAGGDLLFDEKLCEQGRNFSNKIWNALKLLKGFQIDKDIPTPDSNKVAIAWFTSYKNQVLEEVKVEFSQYRLSEALIQIYRLVWFEYCSWFLEMIKPEYGRPIDEWTYHNGVDLLEELMIILHPFMPFVTEEIYQNLKVRSEGDDCMMQIWPEAGEIDSKLLSNIETMKDLVSKVRDVKNKNQLKLSEQHDLQIESGEFTQLLTANPGIKSLLAKMAGLKSLEFVSTSPDQHASTIVSGTTKGYFILPEGNKEEEIQKLEEELQYAEGFVNSIQKKLSNERFVNNAPEQVVAKERQKLADGEQRIRLLKDSLEKLR